MKKKIKIAILLFILLILYVYVANITLFPKTILLIQGEKLNLATLWGIKLEKANNSGFGIVEYSAEKTMEASTSAQGEESIGKMDFNLKLFDMQLGEINVNVVPKTKVIPLGDAIGLKLYTEGVLVVGMSEIEGKKPYENTGIKEGDRIISINDNKIDSTEELIETVNLSGGKEVKVKYISKDAEETVNILPAKTKENEYKLGLWVRDAAAGVGTVTFYEPSTGKFASLGHGISDIDTGELITISNGELVTTNIVTVKKGEKGNPGEIRGSIEACKTIGNVSKNTSFGIFGTITNKNNLKFSEKEMEVASREEIKTGNAQIICEIETGKKRYYDVEIQRIYSSNNKDNKSMLVKVTDKDLLEKTGGIIQGMSGSPIIQNGKFVGAITHVLVNDPTTGYGVFADIMLKQMAQI